MTLFSHLKCTSTPAISDVVNSRQSSWFVNRFRTALKHNFLDNKDEKANRIQD